MENRYKFHQKAWKKLQESTTSGVVPALSEKDFAAIFFDCVRKLNPILAGLQKLDKKFPPRTDGTTFLEISELANIVEGFEKVAKYCHENSPCDKLAVIKIFRSLLSRLGDYFVAISEYSGIIPGMEEMIIQLAQAVQDIRKEFRRS